VTLIEFARTARDILAWICLVPAVAGSVYAVLCLLAVARLRTRKEPPPRHTFAEWPPVSMLKPVCGLEKGLAENLRRACRLDYPAYQVVLSVQAPDDPALPLLREVAAEFGPERATVVVGDRRVGANGKINNLVGALAHARHDILVISDSDVRLRPDYLKTVVAPLADPAVGYVCTYYRAVEADNWLERLELLTLNADLTVHMTFAQVTGAVRFLMGASTALRRSTLEAVGGFEALADYLAEDFELGRRIWESGGQPVILPYRVDTVVDLDRLARWWHHLVHWDQCNRAARPVGSFAAVVIRAMPFALLFAVLRLGDAAGLAVLGGALLARLATAAVILGWGFRDGEGLRSLWLLPLRDLAGLASWVAAFTRRTTVWRGRTFRLTRHGRLLEVAAKP
jgi:ceramide glucosyltransferase